MQFRKDKTKYSSESVAAKIIEKPKCDFVVEGQTEELYLKSLKNNPLLPYIISKIYNLKGSKNESIFESCDSTIKKLLKNPRPNKIVCVFDVDVCYGRNNLKNYKKFKSLLLDYKNEVSKNELLICESLPSIEFWFLTHFENVTRYMTAVDAVAALKKHISAYGKSDKFLSSFDWSVINNHLVSAIKSQNRISEDEKLLYGNDINISYSNVYKLFQV